MKKYVIFVNNYSEGWRIDSTTDDFAEAVKMREIAMGHGNLEVVIFSPVKLIVTEEK